MSGKTHVYVGPYAEWLVPGSLTVTWVDLDGRRHRGKRAEVWTKELHEIVQAGRLNLNLTNCTPQVRSRSKVKRYQVCAYPGVTPGGARGRPVASTDNDSANVIDLTEVDREAEIDWFRRSFRTEVDALTTYFETPLRAIRWGYIAYYS
jgi:hypothetical protein